MADLSPRQRLLNLQNFVNEKIGQNLDLTEGVKVLAESGGGDDIQFSRTTLYTGTEPTNLTFPQVLDNFDIIEFHVKCESDDSLSKNYYTIPRAINYVLARIMSNGRWLGFTSRFTNKYVLYDWTDSTHLGLKIGNRRDMFVDSVVGIKITNKTVTINRIFEALPYEVKSDTINSTKNIFDNTYLFNLGGSNSWDEMFVQDTPTILKKNDAIFGNMAILEGFRWTGIGVRSVKEYEILGDSPVLGIWGLQFD